MENSNITSQFSNCKGCGRLVEWIKTKAGKDMPVDYPDLITIITKDGETKRGYIPHWATCPKAKQFKGKKSVCCKARLIDGAQCECCGADGRKFKEEKNAT